MRVLKLSTIPSIMICAENLESLVCMMIDIDAGRNSIKQNAVVSELPIDVKIVSKLTDINNLKLYPIGKVKINILGYPIILNIIPNEVPINENGVLGYKKLKNKLNTNYIPKCLEIQNNLYSFESSRILSIPARIVTTFCIPIENIDKSEGNIRRLYEHIGEEIHVRDEIESGNVNCSTKFSKKI